MIEENPGTSRKIANVLNVSNGSVWKTFRDYLLYPYHNQISRKKSSCWFSDIYCNLLMIFANVHSNSPITLVDFFLMRRTFQEMQWNYHVCYEENSHKVLEDRFQVQFLLNVWVRDCFKKLVFPLKTHTAELYRNSWYLRFWMICHNAF